MALPVLPYISFLQGFAFFSFNIVIFMTILSQSLSLVLMTGVCIRNPADKKKSMGQGSCSIYCCTSRFSYYYMAPWKMFEARYVPFRRCHAALFCGKLFQIIAFPDNLHPQRKIKAGHGKRIWPLFFICSAMP